MTLAAFTLLLLESVCGLQAHAQDLTPPHLTLHQMPPTPGQSSSLSIYSTCIDLPLESDRISAALSFPLELGSQDPIPGLVPPCAGVFELSHALVSQWRPEMTLTQTLTWPADAGIGSKTAELTLPLLFSAQRFFAEQESGGENAGLEAQVRVMAVAAPRLWLGGNGGVLTLGVDGSADVGPLKTRRPIEAVRSLAVQAERVWITTEAGDVCVLSTGTESAGATSCWSNPRFPGLFPTLLPDSGPNRDTDNPTHCIRALAGGKLYALWEGKTGLQSQEIPSGLTSIEAAAWVTRGQQESALVMVGARATDGASVLMLYPRRSTGSKAGCSSLDSPTSLLLKTPLIPNRRGTISSLLQGNETRIFVGQESTLQTVRWTDAQVLTQESTLEPGVEGSIESLAATSTSLWIGTTRGLFQQVFAEQASAGDQWVKRWPLPTAFTSEGSSVAPALTSVTVLQTVQLQQGTRVWVGSSSGLLACDDVSGACRVQPTRAQGPGGVSVQAAGVGLDPARFWLGDSRGGLHLLQRPSSPPASAASCPGRFARTSGEGGFARIADRRQLPEVVGISALVEAPGGLWLADPQGVQWLELPPKPEDHAPHARELCPESGQAPLPVVFQDQKGHPARALARLSPESVLIGADDGLWRSSLGAAGPTPAARVPFEGDGQPVLALQMRGNPVGGETAWIASSAGLFCLKSPELTEACWDRTGGPEALQQPIVQLALAPALSGTGGEETLSVATSLGEIYQSVEGDTLTFERLPLLPGGGFGKGSISGMAYDARGNLWILLAGTSPFCENSPCAWALVQGEWVGPLDHRHGLEPTGKRVVRDATGQIWLGGSVLQVSPRLLYSRATRERVSMVVLSLEMLLLLFWLVLLTPLTGVLPRQWLKKVFKGQHWRTFVRVTQWPVGGISLGLALSVFSTLSVFGGHGPIPGLLEPLLGFAAGERHRLLLLTGSTFLILMPMGMGLWNVWWIQKKTNIRDNNVLEVKDKLKMYDYLVDQLKKAISDHKVVIIVGAGTSIGATEGGKSDGYSVASWKGLLQHGAQHCMHLEPGIRPDWKRNIDSELDSNELDEMLSAATKIAKKLGAPANGTYAAWLRDTVGKLVAIPAKSGVLQALAALKAPLATTNYDHLLERATSQDAITWEDESAAIDFLSGKGEGILHLHGSYRRPGSVILDIRDYERALQSKQLQQLLRTMFHDRTLLFVGCGAGLEDPNFGALLKWAGSTLEGLTHFHFRLALLSEVAELQKTHPPEQHIKVIPYGAKHEDLAGFLSSLKTP